MLLGFRNIVNGIRLHHSRWRYHTHALLLMTEYVERKLDL